MVDMRGATGAPAAATPPPTETSYRLPIPADLLTANQAWLANPPAATPAPPAAPVVLPVPAGTEVDAVTSGTIAAVAGTAVSLAGADGATYLYAGVAAPPPAGTAVTPGQRIGSAGPTGITFGITVPDTSGQVCAAGALQAWSANTSVDVHALPRTCAPMPSPPAPPAPAPPPTNLLIVTDSAAGQTAADLTNTLRGGQVTSETMTLDESQPPQAQADQIARAQVTPANVVVMALGSTTPAEASMLMSLLPPGQQVFWVVPPTPSPAAASAPSQAAAYAAIVAAHPNLRIQQLPNALNVVTTSPPNVPAPPAWSDVGAQVVSSLVSNYSESAFQLPLASAKASAVLSYAEAQLGKAYVWAAAGPDTFDCSGLTMMAFHQVGMEFVHNAYAQYEATKQYAVSANALQPGDLVFFGPTEAGIHHVGISLGGNKFIDAPDTGSVVRFDTLGPGWDYFGATDPLALFSSAGGSTGGPGGGYSGTTTAGPGGLDSYHAFALALSNATWDPTQYGFLVQLWNQESGWNPTSMNATSGAFGIPQALPANKMASAGADWATDPFTQILWGIGYVQGRYGNPAAAWAHEMAFGWY
jgi:cell wall-associated NlpC family hydrolase